MKITENLEAKRRDYNDCKKPNPNHQPPYIFWVRNMGIDKKLQLCSIRDISVNKR